MPATADKNHTIIFIPAFAEEQNRSRRMVSLQARRLAETGYRVLVADLYGTGDSQGDFAEATFDIWMDDLASLMRFADRSGNEHISLWAQRTGALLALNYLQVYSPAIAGVVLWQPCVSGKMFLRQFLRLRLASSVISGDGEQETSAILMERFSSGNSVEVAGYELSSALALALEGISLEQFSPGNSIPIYWFDVIQDEEAEMPVPSKKVVSKWLDEGADVTPATALGEPFWSIQEITCAPLLIDATSAVFPV